MKGTLLFALLSTLLLSLLASSAAFSHSKLASSIPADGQSLAQSPRELRLNFNRPVTLMTVKVALADAGQGVDTGFSASSEAAKQYQLPLPVLAPGSYQVRWMALGADGHKVKGSFGFVVADAVTGGPEI